MAPDNQQPMLPAAAAGAVADKAAAAEAALQRLVAFRNAWPNPAGNAGVRADSVLAVLGHVKPLADAVLKLLVGHEKLGYPGVPHLTGDNITDNDHVIAAFVVDEMNERLPPSGKAPLDSGRYTRIKEAAYQLLQIATDLDMGDAALEKTGGAATKMWDKIRGEAVVPLTPPPVVEPPKKVERAVPQVPAIPYAVIGASLPSNVQAEARKLALAIKGTDVWVETIKDQLPTKGPNVGVYMAWKYWAKGTIEALISIITKTPAEAAAWFPLWPAGAVASAVVKTTDIAFDDEAIKGEYAKLEVWYATFEKAGVKPPGPPPTPPPGFGKPLTDTILETVVKGGLVIGGIGAGLILLSKMLGKGSA